MNETEDTSTGSTTEAETTGLETGTEIAQDSQVSDHVDAQSEPQGTSEADEPFFDPNSIPDEIKPAYKQMQGAYTKKTQAIAAERKAMETELAELRTKAEIADKYQPYAPILDEMLAKGKEKQTNPQLAILEDQLRERGYADEAIELIKLGAEFTLNTVNQNTSMRDAQVRLENGIQDAAQADARLTDPNLVYQVGENETVTFGQLVAESVAADPNWTQDPKAATVRAIKKIDALINSAKTEGKKELSDAARAKSQKFPDLTTSPQSAVSTDAPKSIFEAAKMAEEQLGY